MSPNIILTQKREKLEAMIMELAQKFLSGEGGVETEVVSESEATRRVERQLDATEGDIECDGSMYCKECKLWFTGRHTPNRKHCWSCNKCVTGFDHHCRYLNQCVGESAIRSQH